MRFPLTPESVYVIDDDEAVRESLLILIEMAGYKTRGYASALDFLTVAPDLTPGCLITDVRMPHMDGIELLQVIAAKGLEFAVIVITGHGDIPMAVEAMRAGALDFIEKPFEEAAIHASIASALEALEKRKDRDQASEIARERLAALSAREREVLEGLIAGLPNKTIAYDLGISPRTVEIHRAHVMEKMQARSLSELVRLGLSAGIEPKRG
jgi:two-component system response regulator FixJ